MFFQVLYQPKNSTSKTSIDRTEAETESHAIEKIKSKHYMTYERGFTGKWFTQIISK